MASLLFLLRSSSKVAQLQAGTAALEKQLVAERSKCAEAWEIEERLARARTEFLGGPTPENTAELLRLMSIRGGAAEVVQLAGIVEGERRQKGLAKLRSLMHAVADETETALQTRLTEVRAEDALRSEELGQSCSSDLLLRTLERKLQYVAEARGLLDSDAIGAAKGRLGQAADVSF